jgi:hypothetical protein
VFGVTRKADRIVAYTRGPASIKERALLLALVEFAPNIEPSSAALATMLGTSEREIRRLLRSAEAKGLLHVEQRKGQRSRYVLAQLDPGHIVLPNEADEPRTERPPTPDTLSSPPRTPCPPKQTRKADKKADKDREPFRLAPPPDERTAKSDDGTAHRRVTAHYFAEFEAKHDTKPVFGGRGAKSVAVLLESLGGDADEACRRITNALGSWRKGVTIHAIARNPDEFVSADPPRATRTVQTGGAYDALGRAADRGATAYGGG